MCLENEKFIIEILKLFFLAVAGSLSIWIFFRDRKLKTAETLLKLEEEYRKHIPLLLEIEDIDAYKNKFSSAIDKANKIYERRKIEKTFSRRFTKNETDSIQKLESMLRHLLICVQIRQCGINKNVFDNPYRYYLSLLLDRPELALYIKNYWGSIYHWAESARCELG